MSATDGKIITATDASVASPTSWEWTLTDTSGKLKIARGPNNQYYADDNWWWGIPDSFVPIKGIMVSLIVSVKEGAEPLTAEDNGKATLTVKAFHADVAYIKRSANAPAIYKSRINS